MSLLKSIKAPNGANANYWKAFVNTDNLPIEVKITLAGYFSEEEKNNKKPTIDQRNYIVTDQDVIDYFSNEELDKEGINHRSNAYKWVKNHTTPILNENGEPTGETEDSEFKDTEDI